MKEIPVLPLPTLQLMKAFGSRITKRKTYYAQFKPILQQQFSHIIQESINKCISCGKCFIGKSIGPHYKKSKQCYLKKCAVKQGTQEMAQPTPSKENTDSCPFKEPKEISGGDMFYESEEQDDNSELDLDEFLIPN